jgi:hypothetical protein
MVYETTGTVVKKKDPFAGTGGVTSSIPSVTGTVTTSKSPMAQAASNVLGNGGINYATANAAGRQGITSNQAQIKNNDAYRQSEIARTLATITNRQQQGLDTGAQTKYLNTNLGYQSPMAQAAANMQASGVKPPENHAVPGSRTEGTLSKIDNFINNQSQFQFNKPEAFSYDQNVDPAYQAQLAEAKKNVMNQQADTNAGLRATGQGKSSWSETVANSLGNSAMESIANNLVPQLMQQAYQRYNDDANRSLDVQKLNYGVGQDAVNNLGNLYNYQNQEYFQNPLAEAQVTGNYLPTAAKDAINNLLSLKQQAETKGITAEDRSVLSKQADFIRNQLTSMGVDASQYGANVNYNSASQANPGIRTLSGQQVDLQNKQANLNAATTYMDATGKLVTPQNDWSGYLRQAANPNAQQTLYGQNQAFNQNMEVRKQDNVESQQGIENAFRDREQSFNEGQQLWRNSFDSAKFEEDKRQYGLNHAIDEQAQKLREDQFTYDKESNAQTKKDLESAYKSELADMILSQNLSDEDTKAMLKKYGITDAMIQEYMGNQ